MDINLIDNVVFMDKGADMYVWSADYNGIEMTYEQIDEINLDFEKVAYLYYKFR